MQVQVIFGAREFLISIWVSTKPNISLHCWSQESLDIAQHWGVSHITPIIIIIIIIEGYYPRYCPGHHITQPPIKWEAAECEECKRQLRTAKPHPLTGQHHLYHHHHHHHHRHHHHHHHHHRHHHHHLVYSSSSWLGSGI